MSSLLWKRRLGRLYAAGGQGGPRRVILIYHTLGATAPAVSVSAFREQLGWLVAHAELVSLAQLLDEPGSTGLRVALTFDDGYASLHDEVAPILQQYGASATVYLNTGHIGEQQRQASDPHQGHYPGQQFLLWSEVQALHKARWCIGSHGVAHLDLTRAEPAVAAGELRASKAAIEARLQVPCEHFAYTWGRYTARLQQEVRSAGYRSAVSALHGPVRAASDPFALPRIDVRTEYELSDFIAAVSGRWDWLGCKQRLARKFA